MVLRRVAALGLLAMTVACARVREVFEPAQFIAQKHPPIVYVTQRGSALVVLENPRVSGDTLLGTVSGEVRQVAFPFRDVHSVSALRVDRGRTALFALGVTAGAVLTAYVIFGTANGNNPGWVCDYDPPEGRPGGGPVCGFTN
jgi:hypothetical protein